MSRGPSPDSPAASRMKKRFSAGMRSTRPRPRSADEADRQGVVREQAVEAVGDDAHREGVEPAGALVRSKHLGAAGIEPEPHRVDDGFGERRRVLEPEIQPLAGDRVDDMRRVAEKREALGLEAASPARASPRSPICFADRPSPGAVVRAQHRTPVASRSAGTACERERRPRNARSYRCRRRR
jgi:hypothetical protein